MRLRGEMHNRVQLLGAQELLDQRAVGNVAFDKSEFAVTPDRLEIREISRVRQCIKHNDAVVRVLAQPMMHEVAADEPGTTGDKQPSQDSPLAARRAAAGASERVVPRSRRWCSSCRAR